MRVSAAKRLLLVHAHPDDETINNGVTMAKYAASGAQVTLVTCTRGEEGEVLVTELANLASDKDDKLGEHREVELKNWKMMISNYRRRGYSYPTISRIKKILIQSRFDSLNEGTHRSRNFNPANDACSDYERRSSG